MHQVKALRGYRTGALCGCLIALNFVAFLTAGSEAPQPGALELSVVDEASTRPTPARVELVDMQGHGYVADDALPIPGGDCEDRIVPVELTVEQAIAAMSKKIESPYTGAVQFYTMGNSKISLASGDYELTIRKGPEYQLEKRDVQIHPGETTQLTVKMSRLINLPAQGWYSAEGHVHIARPVKELNPFITKWMQAEDLHIANLLQWGAQGRSNNSPQYAFGQDGLYREGDYILATGQETPRSFLGHAVIYGAKSPIRFDEAYVIYRLFWEEAQRQGALKGYVHHILFRGKYGLAIDLPSRLLNFQEILQYERANYDIWYDMLNLGFRMTPTAGSDYPCNNINLPGRERLYTLVEGPLTYGAWLEGVRKGRTFVTNGPILKLHINGNEIGNEVVLKKPGQVLVEGRVLFDPARDDVQRAEVIANGESVRSFTREGPSGEISFQFQYEVKESCWIALRASGEKLDEPPKGVSVFGLSRTSLAHTAPIYVTIEGTPPLSAQPRAKALAREWLARLEDLEARLTEDFDHFSKDVASHRGLDGVDVDILRKNRGALLQEIRAAKKYYADIAR